MFSSSSRSVIVAIGEVCTVSWHRTTFCAVVREIGAVLREMGVLVIRGLKEKLARVEEVMGRSGVNWLLPLLIV